LRGRSFWSPQGDGIAEFGALNVPKLRPRGVKIAAFDRMFKIPGVLLAMFLSLVAGPCAQAQVKPGHLLLNLTLNNQGTPELGFADGVVPSLFRDSMRVANTLQLKELETRVEPLHPQALRLHFVKPLVIQLVDTQTGEILPPRLMRFVDVELESEMARAIRAVAQQEPLDVVSFVDMPSLIAKYLQTVFAKGQEFFVKEGFADLPEIFRIESVSVAFSLAALIRPGIPARPYSLRLEGRRVEDASGTLDDARMSTSKPFSSMANINQSEVQLLLTETQEVRRRRQALLQQSLRERGLIPSAQIIPFPGKPSCAPDLESGN